MEKHIIVKKYEGRMSGESYSFVGILDDYTGVDIPQAIKDNGEDVWKINNHCKILQYGSYGHGYTTYLAIPLDQIEPIEMIGKSPEELYNFFLEYFS